MMRSRISLPRGQRFVRPAAFLAAALAATVAVHAFSMNGYTWASHQVAYYINPSNLDGLSAWAVESAIGAGANAWGTQSNADFQFYYAGRTTGSTTGNNGKNEVFFRDIANGGTAGVTYWWYSGGFLVDLDIVFYDGGVTFFTGTTGCSGGLYLEDISAHSGAPSTPTTSPASRRSTRPRGRRRGRPPTRRHRPVA